MKNDLTESMMVVANKDLGEYEKLKALSTELFLIKYKIFIEDIIVE